MKRTIGVIAISLIVSISFSAEARSVFLNGVDISTIRNRTFENAKVTIDKDGNIRIAAPGYEVKVAGGGVPPKKFKKEDKGGPNPALVKRYYLVTQPSKNYKGSYTFEVKVNGKTRKVVKAGAPQVIVEISKWLKKGNNEIIIAAKRSATAVPSSSSDETSLIIGVGHEEKKIVKIDAIKARVTAKASQVGDVKKQFVLTAE